MNKITAYNTLSTKGSRIVATFELGAPDLRSAMNEANYLAARWNRDEVRPEMIVKFISCNGYVRAV